ncbi:MAG: stage III sporulation protein AB [Eubacteriales bacterium]|nr:stage III sporulation protein AB [Eubacteriales bacterium]
MLKLAATLMLILGGAGTGYARSRELTEREKNLEILLQILFFLKGEIRSGNSPLPHAFREIAGKIEGSFSKILLDAAQEMEDSGGSNLAEILEHCIQKRNFAGAQKNEEEGIGILQTLGRRLGYLDREQQICQIELLEAETEERRRKLREKLPEQKKICQSLGILGGILLAVLFW